MTSPSPGSLYHPVRDELIYNHPDGDNKARSRDNHQLGPDAEYIPLKLVDNVGVPTSPTMLRGSER